MILIISSTSVSEKKPQGIYRESNPCMAFCAHVYAAGALTTELFIRTWNGNDAWVLIIGLLQGSVVLWYPGN
jgi:hypothetical protein